MPGRIWAEVRPGIQESILARLPRVHFGPGNPQGNEPGRGQLESSNVTVNSHRTYMKTVR